MAQGLPERAKSASTTFQFKLSGNEQWGPTFATVMAPVLFVAKLAFTSAEAHDELQEAWKRQVVKQGKAAGNKRPWMAVSGPTGAMLHSLRRLGWRSISAFKRSTDQGQQVDTRADAPSTIRQLLSETIKRMLWREWVAAPSAKQSGFRRSPLGYMTELIQEWTSISACENQAAVEKRCRKKDWSTKKAGCLGSTAVGGQWTQERLYLAGFVDSPICFACQAGIGTVPHRTWCCRSLHWDRVQGISSELVQEAREALEQEPHHPLLVSRSDAEGMDAHHQRLKGGPCCVVQGSS